MDDKRISYLLNSIARLGAYSVGDITLSFRKSWAEGTDTKLCALRREFETNDHRL